MSDKIQLSAPILWLELKGLWQAIQNDPLKPFFWTDFAPRRLEQWAEMLHDEYVQAWVIHTTELGVMGMAQVSGRRMTANRQPLYGELDVYLKPEYRGRQAAAIIRTVTGYLLGQGYQNLLAYIRRDHRRSCHMAAYLGWHRVGVVPKYMPCEGRLYDAVLFSLMPPQEVI